MRYKLHIFWLFIFCSLTLLSAQGDREGLLMDKAKENRELLFKDPEKALSEIEGFLKEARKTGDQQAELTLLANLYLYHYYQKLDFEAMITAARELQAKAVAYNDIRFQGIANGYLFEAYAFNELYDKALYELQQGIKTLNRADPNDPVIIKEKANRYTDFANLYNQQGNIDKMFENLFLATKQHDRLPESKEKRLFKSWDYANIAAAHMDYDLYLDSVEYYALKSIDLRPASVPIDNNLFINYIVLGHVNYERKNYPHAISYYRKAEDIPQQKHYKNVESLYKKMILAYEANGEQEKKREYEYKLQELQLTVSQNQNKSLHKIMKEDSSRKNAIITYIIIGVIILVVFFSVLLIRMYRKNQHLAEQEKRSQEYLEHYQSVLQKQESPAEEESYHELLEMVKKKDPAFLAAFNDKFPGFAEKLQAINYKIVQTEIEFCALMKLNLATKEIAKYRNIEPRSVQNKKYRIRKKLNIPENMDIYFWFSQL